MTKANKAVVLLFLSVLCYGGSLNAQTTQTYQPASVVRPEKYYRTELYFGRSRPDGTMVSDDEWKNFLSETVTPRFPDGFTALKATGQYREKSGRIISEPSETLIFFYSSRGKKESRVKIEEIRAAYMKMFQQESVLRVDLPKSVSVSF